MISGILMTLWIIGVIVNWAMASLLYCGEYRPKHKWFYPILAAVVLCSFVTWIVALALIMLDREK